MIQLNFSYMMEETIGEKGIAEREIESVRPKISDFHDRITGRKRKEFGFLDTPGQDLSEIRNIARHIREEFRDLLVLGIGGSALGPRAILEALSPFHNLKETKRVFIYDNVDPRTLHGILSLLNLKDTAVNVITKSGSTAETAASFMILWEKMKEISRDRASSHFIATTDPEKGNLRSIVKTHGLRSLPIPPEIGGRYSVLTPVGLLPAEFAGIDSGELLRGARDLNELCSDEEIWKNPAYIFAALVYLMQKQEGRDITVMIPYADSLKSFSEWFCQLWSESLGKQGTGLTPYPSVGTTDQHSQLQLWMQGPDNKAVTFIRIEDYNIDYEIPSVFDEVEGISYLGGRSLSELIQAEEESSELALAKAGKPNMTVTVPKIDAYHLGQLFQFFELVTALTGFLFGINPFDQPGVEEGKNFTYGMMGKKGFEEKRSEVLEARGKKVCLKL